MTVVEAVADATEIGAGELPLLYEVVDPDALDTLFAPKQTGQPRVSGQVTFTFAGCEVTVTSEGTVSVCAPSKSIDDTEPTSRTT